MYKLKSAVFSGLAGVCLALAAMPANAAQETHSSCLDAARQAKAALDASGQSPNYDAALKEWRSGNEFCNAGYYRQGVAHYEQAEKLLDPDSKS